MPTIIVTPKTNVQVDDEGKIKFFTDELAREYADRVIEGTDFEQVLGTPERETEEQEAWEDAYNAVFSAPILLDDEDLGSVIKTHVITMTQTAEGVVMQGLVCRLEVLWNKRRNPAPDLLDPSDLVWISMDNDEAEDD